MNQVPQYNLCLDCGVQSLHAKSDNRGLNKMAEPGDWPWHVALFKEEVHVCDATLVAENWLITTASCFQGYILLFLDYFKYKNNVYAAFLCHNTITDSQRQNGQPEWEVYDSRVYRHGNKSVES